MPSLHDKHSGRQGGLVYENRTKAQWFCLMQAAANDSHRQAAENKHGKWQEPFAEYRLERKEVLPGQLLLVETTGKAHSQRQQTKK